MTVTLKGLTWDHPRGYAPLVGGAAEYESLHPGVQIHWDRRTLREFGEAPLEQYIDRYDLIVVDHPFVGFAAAHETLLDLTALLSEKDKAHFARDSVGPSWASYWYADALWALPLDAATQVASYRPDLLAKLNAEPPDTLDAVIRLGRMARKSGQSVIVPACPTDAISLFFTLTASLGYPIAEDSDPFVQPSPAREALGLLRELVAVSDPHSLDWNPIQVYDFMVSSSQAVYCPYGFGYSNYSRGEQPTRLQFTDAPAAGRLGCSGTTLGGTGIAVSSASAHRDQAVDYALWLVSVEHQRGTYFRKGGQPASLAAWMDAEVNRESNDFFRDTLQTLQSAYVRPRFDGFVRFFEAAGIRINRCLRGEGTDETLVRWLNEHYAASWTAVQATRSGSKA